MTWQYTVSIFLGFIGLLIAGYIHHKKTRKEPLICPLKSNCRDVIQSDFSRFFGMPVEVIGMLYYAFIALLYGAKLIWLEVTWLVYLLLPSTTVAFLFSLYLTFIQFFSLRKLCTWCLTSAVICTLLAVFAYLGSWDLVIPFFSTYSTPILILHLFGMSLGLGATFMADIFFFRFLQDFRISEAESSMLRAFSEVIWFALGIIVVTGVGLFLPQQTELLASSKFLLKMIVVGVIVINGSLLNLLVAPKLIHITFRKEHQHREGELHRLRRLAFTLGPISMISWLSAFVLGAMPVVNIPLLHLLAVYLLLLASGILFGLLTDRLFVKRASIL